MMSFRVALALSFFSNSFALAQAENQRFSESESADPTPIAIPAPECSNLPRGIDIGLAISHLKVLKAGYSQLAKNEEGLVVVTGLYQCIGNTSFPRELGTACSYWAVPDVFKWLETRSPGFASDGKLSEGDIDLALAILERCVGTTTAVDTPDNRRTVACCACAYDNIEDAKCAPIETSIGCISPFCEWVPARFGRGKCQVKGKRSCTEWLSDPSTGCEVGSLITTEAISSQPINTFFPSDLRCTSMTYIHCGHSSSDRHTGLMSNIIRVCQTAYKCGSIEIDNRGCLGFSDPVKAQEALLQITADFERYGVEVDIMVTANQGISLPGSGSDSERYCTFGQQTPLTYTVSGKTCAEEREECDQFIGKRCNARYSKEMLCKVGVVKKTLYCCNNRWKEGRCQ